MKEGTGRGYRTFQRGGYEILVGKGAKDNDRLMKAAAATLQILAADRLGLRLGITVVLHTWTRELLRHPHVHCIVSAGGETLDGGGWTAIDRPFLFPAAVMKTLFRGKLLASLKASHRIAPLDLPDQRSLRDLLAPLYQRDWVVHAKAPLASHRLVVRYLGAYTRRVAISNRRVLALSDHSITFRARKRTVTLADHEFIRRFLLHVLPKGFRKVRHYGLYAPGNAARLAAVGDDMMDQLADLPGDLAAPDRRAGSSPGRLCPLCEEGILVYAFPLVGDTPLLDSS